jgi:ABC-type glutathione transport system ATPase component
MITHDLDIVAESAGRVLGFEAGRLIDDATPSALFSERAKTDQELATAPTVVKRLAEEGLLLDDAPLTVDELADSLIKVFPGASA